MVEKSIPKCLCGLEAVIHARSKGGQRYYQCPKGSMDPTGCSFFLACKESTILDIDLTKSDRHIAVSHESRDNVDQDELSMPTRRSVHDDSSNEQVKTQVAYNQNAICFQCGGQDHLAKDCPLMVHKPVKAHERADHDAKNASSSGTCFYCKELGHFAAECPKKKKDIEKRKTCFRCRQVGHWASQCPTKRTIGPPGQVRGIHTTTVEEKTQVKDTMEEGTKSPKAAEKRKPEDAIEMPPPKIPPLYLVKEGLPVTMDVRKLPLSMRGGGRYTR